MSARSLASRNCSKPTRIDQQFKHNQEYEIMANIDSHVARVLDEGNSDDEDALIASLEDSPALDAFREQRIQQLHSEFTRAKSQKNQGFGNYTEIKEEKVLMDLTTEVKYAVVHFAKDDFARCGVMDEHLEVRGLPLREYRADLRRVLHKSTSILDSSR